jgi:hypothetical protein
MRAIRRFPLPDSHVSLSAVLEPGPNAQPALPPRTTPATKQLTPKLRATAPETNPDRHAPTPQPTATANRATNLATRLPHHPNRCEFESWHAASKALTRFNHQPTPPIAHDTRTSRPESTQPATPPAPANCERKPNRLCKLFPPQAPASAPMRRSTSKATDQDKTWTLALSELGHRRPAFRVAVHSANYLFARCVSIYQLKTLTEQGAHEHYIAFLRR